MDGLASGTNGFGQGTASTVPLSGNEERALAPEERLSLLPSSRNTERRLRSNSRIAPPAPLPRDLAAILVGQLEVDCDLRLNFDGLAVEEIGFVLPLKDGFLGRASEYGITS